MSLARITAAARADDDELTHRAARMPDHDLRSSLAGVTCVVIHIKGLTTLNDQRTCAAGAEQAASNETRIAHELDFLERRYQLGIRFTVAKQGMRLGASGIDAKKLTLEC